MSEDIVKMIDDLSQRDFIVFAGAGVPEITRVLRRTRDPLLPKLISGELDIETEKF